MPCNFEPCVEARIELKIDFDFWSYPDGAKTEARKLLEDARRKAEQDLNKDLGKPCPKGCRCVLIGNPTVGEWGRGPTVAAEFEFQGRRERAAALSLQRMTSTKGVCFDPDRELVVPGEPEGAVIDGIMGGGSWLVIQAEEEEKKKQKEKDKVK